MSTNVDNPHGFWPVGSLDGGESYVKIMRKLVGYGTAVGIYDPVVWAGTQNNIQRAAATAPTFGISLAYSPLSTAATHPVLVLTNQVICEAQEDAVGGTIGVDGEGANGNFIVANCCAVTGISQCEIDSNTVTTTTTLDLHLLKVAPFPDNYGASAYSRWLVTFNNVGLANQVAGV